MVLDDRGSNSGKGKALISSQNTPHPLWGSLSLLFKEVVGA
jgi:hypothetical protein